VQEVLNAVFARATSTEHSLLLLRQFERLLHSDSFRADLDAKYAAAFLAYAADLEAVQALYERHKAAPPRARAAPPVAGCIAWSRHLLRRVEAPMARFRARPALLASKEGRRAVRTYNRLCQALLECEGLWHAAWLRSVDNARAQLTATLLTEHPDTGGWGGAAVDIACMYGKQQDGAAGLLLHGGACHPVALPPPAGALLVNFDRGVLQLMREARHMRRLGLAIPEAAAAVLAQEEKLELYFSQLSHAVQVGGGAPAVHPSSLVA
jgi:dynein heavy chain